MADTAIGCVFAGLGGALYAHLTRYVSPDSFSLEISFFFSLVVIVGGMGSFWGPFLGAVGLLFLPETLHVFQEFKLLVYGFILLICIVMLPKGLVSLPDRFRKKKIPEASRGSVSMEGGTLVAPQISIQHDREILRILGVSKSFGELTALNDVSLSIKEGSIHGLIGRRLAPARRMTSPRSPRHTNRMEGKSFSKTGTLLCFGRIK